MSLRTSDEIQNGDFSQPPGDETLPISDTNPIAGWTFVQSVGTGTLEAFRVANTSGNGGHIEWVATAAATSDEAYLEQPVYVVGNDALAVSMFPYYAHVSLGGAVALSDTLTAQYLDADGATTGTSGSTTGPAAPAIANDTGVVPADAQTLRLRVGITVAVGPATGTGPFGASAVWLDRATSALRVTDGLNTTLDALSLVQNDGYAVIQSGGGAGITAGPGGIDLIPPATKPVTITTHLDMVEVAAPATPGAGAGRFYVKTDSTPHFIDDGGTDIQLGAAGGGGAPTTVDYLVGTADAGLSAEIVVGTSPGGELGGTWASPTVDATHSGSSHAATQTAAEATAAAALSTHAGTSHPPISADYLVGTANAGLSAEIVVGTSPGGELGGTWASPTVDATHSGSTHTAATTTHEAASDPHTGYRLESALIALADMANLAQDLFIGRTTASTGVPQTATITAAARTVLDDTTVGAMVDTLGGAAAVGTGGLARATSPVFVTPLLGTPTSGVMTNVTGTAAALTAGNLVHTKAVRGPWTRINVAASLTDDDLALVGGAVAVWESRPVAGFAGRILGFAYRLVGTITTSTLIIKGHIGSATTTDTLTLNAASGANPTGAYIFATPEAFTAIQVLGVKVTTTGTFAPATTDLSVGLIVDYDA